MDYPVHSIAVSEFGGFDKIKIMKLPLIPPVCGEHDIEIKVRYCGVNFADLYMRQGLVPNIPLPHILGLECVGVVKQVGEKVTSFKVGQRVLCYNGYGGLYRETVIINENNCFSIPDEIEDEIAVTLPANYLTAYFCLFEIGNLKPGQCVLLHSCAGGVGWAATQLSRCIENVKIVGTCSPQKFLEAEQNGVNYVIKSEKYLEQLKNNEDLIDQKFDIIIDTIGGSNIANSEALLDSLGKLIVIGASQIVTGVGRLSVLKLFKLWWQTKNISVSDLIMKNYTVAGLHLANIMKDKPERIHAAMNHIFDLYKSEKIHPRIDSKFSSSKVTDAMERLSNRENIGKVIIEWN